MPKPYRNVVGPQVRRFRAQRELSQPDLAMQLQLAGLDWGRVELAKVESRIKKVSDAELFTVAQVLKVEINSFFPPAPAVKNYLVNVPKRNQKKKEKAEKTRSKKKV